MQNNIINNEPLIVSFNELLVAFRPLVLGEEKWERLLHDIWKLGAPLPTTSPTVLESNVKRIMSPFRLAYWLKDITTARGMPLTIRQAVNILNGEEDYGFEDRMLQ